MRDVVLEGYRALAAPEESYPLSSFLDNIYTAPYIATSCPLMRTSQFGDVTFTSKVEKQFELKTAMPHLYGRTWGLSLPLSSQVWIWLMQLVLRHWFSCDWGVDYPTYTGVFDYCLPCFCKVRAVSVHGPA